MKKKGENDQMALRGTEEEEMLARLSDRVEKAIATIQQLRKENEQLKERAGKAEDELKGREAAGERLTAVEEENDRFKSERSEIRSRIEQMLSELEGLDEA